MYFHLTFATRGRMVAFPDTGRRWDALHALGRVAGSQSMLHALVDDHQHVVARVKKDTEGRLARALLLAWRAVGADVEPADVRPVTDRAHFRRLVDYLLEQPKKHGLDVHPATWTGSYFPDLVGARRVPGLSVQIAPILPRFRQREAYVVVGLSADPLVIAGPDDIRRLGCGQLTAFAGETFATPITGRTAAAARARTAVATVAAASGIPTSEVAFALGVTGDAVTRILRRTQDLDALADARALRMRVALESVVRASASPGPATLAARREA